MSVQYNRELFEEIYNTNKKYWDEWKDSNDKIENLKEHPGLEALSVEDKLKYMAFKNFKEITHFHNEKPTPDVKIDCSSQIKTSFLGEYTEEQLEDAFSLMKEELEANNFKIVSAEKILVPDNFGSGTPFVGFKVSVKTPEAN